MYYSTSCNSTFSVCFTNTQCEHDACFESERDLRLFVVLASLMRRDNNKMFKCFALLKVTLMKFIPCLLFHYDSALCTDYSFYIFDAANLHSYFYPFFLFYSQICNISSKRLSNDHSYPPLQLCSS